MPCPRAGELIFPMDSADSTMPWLLGPTDVAEITETSFPYCSPRKELGAPLFLPLLQHAIVYYHATTFAILPFIVTSLYCYVLNIG